MKIRIILLLFILVLSFGMCYSYPYARDNGRRKIVDSCQLLVAYNYSFVSDTALMKAYSEKMLLEVGYTTNRYYSRHSEIRDSLMVISFEEGYARDGVSDPAFRLFPKNQRITYRDLYTLKAKNKVKWMDSFKVATTEYQVSENVEKWNWTILQEQDTILGYLCHKAESEFRGRKWYAWFSMDIPYNFGPWKMGGLPGLILKAEDSEGLFNWIAIGIEQPKKRNIYLYSKELAPSYPLDSRWSTLNIRKCTRKELDKLWKRYWVAPNSIRYLENPDLIVEEMVYGSNVSVLVKKDMSVPENVYYPRLELDF